jgi:hypothetical protein
MFHEMNGYKGSLLSLAYANTCARVLFINEEFFRLALARISVLILFLFDWSLSRCTNNREVP